MLTLTIVFLIALYVAKLFFPNEFLIVVEWENIVNIGNFIDSIPYVKLAFFIGIGLVFDYLYFGAVCQRFKLGAKLKNKFKT